MKMKKGVLVGLMVCSVMMASCGTNIFEGLVDSSSNTPRNNQQRVESAEELIISGEATQAIEYLTVVIDELENVEGELTEEETLLLQSSYELRGKAELVNVDLSTLDVLSKVLDGDNANIIDLLDFNVSANQISVAADYYNRAENLSSANQLDASAQIVRGIANTVVVSEMILTVFDVSGNTVTAKNELTGFESLEFLAKPSESSNGDGLENGVFHYAANAIDALGKAGNIDKVTDQTDKVEDLAEKIDRLYATINGTLEDGQSAYESERSGISSTYFSDHAGETDDEDVNDEIQAELEFLIGNLI